MKYLYKSGCHFLVYELCQSKQKVRKCLSAIGTIEYRNNLVTRCLRNCLGWFFLHLRTVFTRRIKLIQGAYALYKPTRSNVVSSMDSLCFDVQKNQKDWHHESLQQCDYEIEYADRSSSLGVLIRDELHLVTTNGSKTKLNFVFGYE